MASLSNLDLVKMVSAHIGIDVYSAKTGSDADVCVLSFRVRGEDAARDLSKFLEKEGEWILDCDVSTGEDNAGKYLVFVELRRNRRLHERIMELLEIVERLTGVLRWQFNAGKKLTVHNIKLDKLEQLVTTTPEAYAEQQQEYRRESMMEFFADAPFNNIVLEGDRLSLQQFFLPHKMHSSVDFTLVSEEVDKDLVEDSSDSLSTSAVWLSKVLGPNITVTESESGFVLTNNKLNKNILVSLNV